MLPHRLTARDRGLVEDFLGRAPLQRLFLGSNLERGGLEDGPSLFQGRWFGTRERERLSALGQAVNQGSLLVAGESPDRVAALAPAFHSLGTAPLRILGMAEEVEALHRGLMVCGPYPVREVRDSSLQVLTPETLAPPRGGDEPGVLRPARLEDVSLLLEWKIRFRVDSLGDDPAWLDQGVMRRSLELTVAEERQVVLEAGGRPVSMARLNATTRRFAQLGGVYTPPELRGRGFGSCLVRALCRGCLDQGREAMALTVDPAKTRANQLYARIGFRPRGTYRFLLLEPGSEEKP